jgi:hypothetical protein
VSTSSAKPVLGVLAGLAGLLAAACSSTPFTLVAAGPFADPAAVNPALDRVAILVTITNRSGGDLNVNPGDFVARDAEHRVYPANPAATISDAGLVSGQAAQRGTLPLPTITLRGDDLISGFVVFDVPAGKQPVELIWRQSDTDTVALLSAGH